MAAFPAGVLGVIRVALTLSLRQDYERYGEVQLPYCELPGDIVTALKSIYAEHPEEAAAVARRALREVSVGYRKVPLDAAALCLQRSLTQRSFPHEYWTSEQAERFVTAALLP